MTVIGAGLLAAAMASLLIAGKPGAPYTVHEWGTFTSVQGGDGELVQWRPLESSILPGFVHNWQQPGLGRHCTSEFNEVKGVALTLQRMETPVIYFYTDEPRVVDVSVRFPKGLITEWYPQANEIGPSTVSASPIIATADKVVQHAGARPGFSFAPLLSRACTTTSQARWRELKLIPERTNPSLRKELPGGPQGEHYVHARETPAAFVRAGLEDSGKPTAELEKFIFYRGIGNFETPLVASLGFDKVLTLRNAGPEKLAHLFALAIDKGNARFIHLRELAPARSRKINLDQSRTVPVAQATDAISAEMSDALVEQGLFAAEAAAMVKTWRDSWFAEEGLRVLYILPRAWTDRTLPLDLDPVPRDIIRVMVGRAEVVSPDVVQQIRRLIVRSAEGDLEARDEGLRELRKLGRFAEPALTLATQHADGNVKAAGRTLLADTHKVDKDVETGWASP